MLDATEAIAGDLTAKGWAVCGDFLAPELCAELAAEIDLLRAAAGLRAAGIGRGGEHQIDRGVRSDLIYWLQGEGLSAPQRAALSAFAELQQGLNRTLYLGVRSFEAHLTLYPPGGAYAKHVDNFRGASPRVVSCILYLTPDYTSGDGGKLRIYGEDEGEVAAEIEPRLGTLACFMSEGVLHEVLATKKDRYSLTGWFRR